MLLRPAGEISTSLKEKKLHPGGEGATRPDSARAAHQPPSKMLAPNEEMGQNGTRVAPVRVELTMHPATVAKKAATRENAQAERGGRKI